MNLYASNLSYHTDDEALKTLFEKFGTVSSAKVIMDRETGRSRGFGFVEMNDTKEANDAIQGLQGKDVQGRAMSVSVAKEKPARSDNKRW